MVLVTYGTHTPPIHDDPFIFGRTHGDTNEQMRGMRGSCLNGQTLSFPFFCCFWRSFLLVSKKRSKICIFVWSQSISLSLSSVHCLWHCEATRVKVERGSSSREKVVVFAAIDCQSVEIVTDVNKYRFVFYWFHCFFICFPSGIYASYSTLSSISVWVC